MTEDPDTLNTLAMTLSITIGLLTVLGGAITWFSGIRVLKHQVQQLEKTQAALTEAQDSGLALRVGNIEKWINDFGDAEQIRQWGMIKETVPELKEMVKELRSRLDKVERLKQE
jgi:hypothetical protein